MSPSDDLAVMVAQLAVVPADRPLALLLRHANREDGFSGLVSNEMPINDLGRQRTHALGKLLSGRLRSIHTSPVRRCRETAEVLKATAGGEAPVYEDFTLGGPGVFVVDEQAAAANWEVLGVSGVIHALVAGDPCLPGMAKPDDAAQALVGHMLARSEGENGIHVFVTHDYLVTATVARVLGQVVEEEHWANYLEGAFFWREKDAIAVCYRDVLSFAHPCC